MTAKFAKRTYKRTQFPIPCAQCGAKAPRFTEEQFIPDDEEYTGDLQVIKTENFWSGKDGEIGRLLRLWNGKDWCTLPYGNFCTTQCAIDYANNVVETRWRSR